MAGEPIATKHLRRSILAFGLCLLAFVFAVEAKLACYDPQQGLRIDVSAAKAFPADIPSVVPHGLSSPDVIHPFIPVAEILAFAAGSALAADAVLTSVPLHNHLSFTAASFFSPPVFFRPPPVR